MSLLALALPLERPAAQRIRIPELTCVCGEFEVVEEAQVRARARTRDQSSDYSLVISGQRSGAVFSSLSLSS